MVVTLAIALDEDGGGEQLRVRAANARKSCVSVDDGRRCVLGWQLHRGVCGGNVGDCVGRGWGAGASGCVYEWQTRVSPA